MDSPHIVLISLLSLSGDAAYESNMAKPETRVHAASTVWKSK